MTSSKAITHCRLCAHEPLHPILDLGDQFLTGVFPKSADAAVDRGPLELVKCGHDECGLVQLRHSNEPSAMYGENYGYRSSLNRAMVEHLRAKIVGLSSRAAVTAGDVVLDIGSNDGTSLSFYSHDLRRIGIDPTAAKFGGRYPAGATAVPRFFDADTFLEASGGALAKIVTSIAMFYDLEAPLTFARHVHRVLRDDGLWHFEQSYLPAMLDSGSYDTVCHEHLEYYAMKQIRYIADREGFRIVDVEVNDVNGGSFAVTVAKDNTPAATRAHAPKVAEMLADEERRGLGGLEAYRGFADGVAAHRDSLVRLVREARAAGKKVFGLGASTKGNVLLQYCGFTTDDIACIADVNPDKYGSFTPGTRIPIVSEQDAYAQKPDYLLVLPWHFRAGLVQNAAPYLRAGGKMIFPLPRLEIVGA